MKQSISFAYSVVVYDNSGETLYTFEDEKKAKELMKQLIAKEKLDEKIRKKYGLKKGQELFSVDI